MYVFFPIFDTLLRFLSAENEFFSEMLSSNQYALFWTVSLLYFCVIVGVIILAWRASASLRYLLCFRGPNLCDTSVRTVSMYFLVFVDLVSYANVHRLHHSLFRASDRP